MKPPIKQATAKADSAPGFFSLFFWGLDIAKYI
jgi:hypothetical protein